MDDRRIISGILHALKIGCRWRDVPARTYVLTLTAFGQTWYDLDRASLNGAQAVVQRFVHPYVWDPIIQTALTWPTFAVALGFSLLFVVIGRPRRRGGRSAWY